jgi:DedD protein
LATQFQNRLIGTVILVSVGVVFLPDLLMGKKNDIAAPAGSIPLRPEQSLVATTAAQQNSTTVVPSNTVSSANSTATTSSAVVTAGSNASVVIPSSASTKVISESPAAVTNNENWKVEEVAGPVTITDGNAVVENTVSVASQKQQAAELAKAKSRELELKKKELLAAAKEKEIAKAKVKEVALETQKVAEDSQPTAPVADIRATETAHVEPETTVRRDESGLTIKTAAQVEAERAAAKLSPATVSTKTVPAAKATASTAAHAGSWIIQVGVFSNAENAQSLASKLRSAGYGASVQRAGQLTRVMVGPDVSKEKLQSMLSNINRVGGTSARVITYSTVGN